MRVLFIVPYVPNLIRVRPFNLIRYLAALGHDVTVLTLWSDQEEMEDAAALRDHCSEVIALPLPRYQSMWNCLRALPTPLPLQAAYCWSASMGKEIARQLSEPSLNGHQPYDVVHVEHLRGAKYGLAVKRLQTISPGLHPPIVWDSVDCISYLFEQAARDGHVGLGRLGIKMDLGRTRRYEGWLVEQFDRVMVTAPNDREALRALYASRTHQPSLAAARSAVPITVLPNGVDLDYFTPVDEPREPDTMVFTGKLSYHANVAAVLHLVRDIMPHVWSRRRHVRLVIAGKDPPREVRALATTHRPLITVTGTVPDIRPCLRRAWVASVPTTYGAGIQNKVLEAMACATPVVASPKAVSALQVTAGQQALVAEDPAEFAQCVLDVMEDEALHENLGRRGREYVETRHDWRKAAEQLEGIYRDAIAGHGARLGAH
jgi:glycosyltransferase involved in cell wall biosynthesis